MISKRSFLNENLLKKISTKNYQGTFEISTKNILPKTISNRIEYDIFGHHFSYLWTSSHKF